MKTSTFISTITMAFLMLISININAQEFAALYKSPMDAASFPTNYKDPNKLLKIVYSRPQLNGRTIEKLAPTGEIWRTGANEAAELTLYAPMIFGDTKIPTGTYTFYVIPGDKQWIAIISKDLNVWGSYFYKKDNDVARLAVPVSINSKSIEAFSIVFEETKEHIIMNLGWGNTRLAVPFNPQL